MFWIVGTIVAIVTFPGAIMQTFAMKFVCDVLDVEVYSVDYLSGKIAYGRLPNAHYAIAVATAPFLINTLLCMVLTFPLAFAVFHGSGTAEELAPLTTGYLGICMGMHAFPDTERMDELMGFAETPTNAILTFLYKLIRWIFWLARLLSILWFDAIYTFLIACTLPWVIAS